MGAAYSGDVRILLADDGARLVVRVRGGGRTTFVFTHGFAQSSACWHHQVDALVAAGHRVVTWDLRGHGTSSAGPGPATIERLTDDLVQVIEQTASEGDLVLVGHSMGGMVLMALGLRHPQLVRDRVRGVAFLSTAVDAGHLAWLGLGERATPVVQRLAGGVFGLLGPRTKAWRLVEIAGPLSEWAIWLLCCGWPTNRADTRVTIEAARGGGFASMHDYLPALLAHDRADGLVAYRGRPALVLNGSADLLVRPDQSDAIAEALPGSRRVLVPHAGHNIMLAAHRRLSQELLRLADLEDWTGD